MLTPTDLFVVGLALDVTGAILLAQGLVIKAREIERLGTWGGVGLGTVVDRVRSRVDAEFGLAFLGLGFGLQTLGYIIQLAGVTGPTGAVPTVVGAVLAAGTAAAATMYWRRSRESRFRSLLVDVAWSREGTGSPDDAEEPGWSNARTTLLVSLGRKAGYRVVDEDRFDEGIDRYVNRVFGIEVPRYLPRPDAPE